MGKRLGKLLRFAYLFLVFSVVVATTMCGCDLFGSATGKPADKEITLTVTQSPITLEVGATVEICADASDGKTVSWYSTDEGIAAVAGGVVMGVAEGSALIIAAAGNLTATCVVNVVAAKKPVQPDDKPVQPEQPSSGSVIMMISPVTVEAGKSVTLSAFSPTGGQVSWRSENDGIATVNGGVITGVKVGETVIIASAGSAQARCKVAVVAPSAPPEEEKPAETEKPVKYLPVISGGAADNFNLVWHDEFDGTALNADNWSYQTGVQDIYNGSYGPLYWGNGELQYYTDSANNVGVRDGNLYITARREAMGGMEFTSARIVTRNKFSRAYGYYEARMKTPTGNGMWPAFWMLPEPTNGMGNEYGGWPVSGEIDVMEARGRLENKVDTTLHYAQAGGSHRYTGEQTTLHSNTDQWHTYAIDWTPDYISWIIDGNVVMRRDKVFWNNNVFPSDNDPFDKPFYILFNFALGGQYDGYVTPDADFTSATMYVDYVRVWARA